MKVLAIIPARSGSKGVKDKNIRPFYNIPLIAYSIHSALKSGVCDEVFVCTDSEKYAEIAKKYGANVPFLRSKESAQDTSKSIDCILESLEKYCQIGKNFDTLILLQPTSPLRTAFHIKEAYKLYCKYQKDLASICEVDEHPIFMRTTKDNILTPLLQTNSTTRRQDLPPFYRINGAIYINKISTLTTNTSFNDNPIGYIMDKEYSLDIDEEKDFTHPLPKNFILPSFLRS
ncbi:cytidylyltransferase domain-containing protein [Helicobacter anatolicus]|uniref:acylneuraminate cytidylyltransferase family protein n=1 Tax=Helicobacter anatolicus TaxID=2905874 RepID=UPI001E450AA2|nr:acylneuraminate cytidylyltransferase family protein [Helicobacter anatolicus]MCE3039256.1 acylneuraminate cytidylyltransferase family protein [Helicobacter anatolicus]